MAAAYFKDPEPGSLSDAYQIKTLICYLLDRVDEPMRQDQINAVFQINRTVNYFNFCQAISEMLQSGHIREEAGKKDSDKWIVLTDLGRETAASLAKNLPLSIRERSEKTAKQLLEEEKNNQGKTISVSEEKDGYYISLSFSDLENSLMELKLFSPNKEQADKMARELKEKTIGIYQSILSILFDDPAPLSETLDEIQRRNILKNAYKK